MTYQNENHTRTPDTDKHTIEFAIIMKRAKKQKRFMTERNATQHKINDYAYDDTVIDNLARLCPSQGKYANLFIRNSIKMVTISSLLMCQTHSHQFDPLLKCVQFRFSCSETTLFAQIQRQTLATLFRIFGTFFNRRFDENHVSDRANTMYLVKPYIS